jgi:hypothetical protein
VQFVANTCSFRRVAHSCEEILQGCRLGDKRYDITHQTHYVLWFGDLNYRTEFDLEPNQVRVQGIAGGFATRPRFQIHGKVEELLKTKAWGTFAEADELTRELSRYVESAICILVHQRPPLRRNHMLANFTPCATNFAPSFKRIRHTLHDYNSKRIPSYTDRRAILSKAQRLDFIQN